MSVVTLYVFFNDLAGEKWLEESLLIAEFRSEIENLSQQLRSKIRLEINNLILHSFNLLKICRHNKRES